MPGTCPFAQVREDMLLGTCVRQGSLAKEEARKQKPLRVTLCEGTCPRPAKAESQPEPSVARDPETETRSVHREHVGRGVSPESLESRGGRRFTCDGRQHPRAEGSVVPEDSSGVVEYGTCARGSPRNLGGPAVSTDRWYTRREDEPKRAWKGSRESERLVVPRRPGNSTREDPAEGRGRFVREPRRERCREHRTPTTSQRNKIG